MILIKKVIHRSERPLKLDDNQKEYWRILNAADKEGTISSEDEDFDPVRELAARVGMSQEE